MKKSLICIALSSCLNAPLTAVKLDVKCPNFTTDDLKKTGPNTYTIDNYYDSENYGSHWNILKKKDLQIPKGWAMKTIENETTLPGPGGVCTYSVEIERNFERIKILLNVELFLITYALPLISVDQAKQIIDGKINSIQSNGVLWNAFGSIYGYKAADIAKAAQRPDLRNLLLVQEEENSSSMKGFYELYDNKNNFMGNIGLETDLTF